MSTKLITCCLSVVFLFGFANCKIFIHVCPTDSKVNSYRPIPLQASERQCHVCNHTDPNCKYAPEKYETCTTWGWGCFVYYESDTQHGRGCAGGQAPLFSDCLKDNLLNCFLCDYHLCNSNPMRVPRKLACVISTATPEEEPHLMPEVCPGELPIASPDYCYMLVGTRYGVYSVVERGCFPYKGIVAPDQALFYCTDQGCNMYTQSNAIGCRLANQTQQTWVESGALSHFVMPCMNLGVRWPPLCYVRVDGGEYADGCLNHIWHFHQVKDCSFYVGGPRTCQTCLTPNKCNTFTKAHTDTVEYNHLNRCRNLNNDLVPCSDIWSQCYLYLDKVEETYLEAGCVEPTTNLTILTSQDTLLCLGNYFPYESCFDLRKRYSNRFSCFKCNDKSFSNSCNDPEDLDVSAREMCPEGIRACVTFVQGKKVMRGCDEPRDPTSQACARHPNLCQYCTTSYCNGLRIQTNPFKCYSTKSFLGDMDSRELRLRKCEDRLPAQTEQPCFIAKKQGSALIKAGCIEDYNDSKGYKLVLQGGTEIIFQEKVYCYKCKSKSLKNCFNVRWHEPVLCDGYGRSAFRGCYTLFDFNFERIERGCASDLDPYRAGLCLAKHFEEWCILCGSSYCNIHTL